MPPGTAGYLKVLGEGSIPVPLPPPSHISQTNSAGSADRQASRAVSGLRQYDITLLHGAAGFSRHDVPRLDTCRCRERGHPQPNVEDIHGVAVDRRAGLSSALGAGPDRVHAAGADVSPDPALAASTIAAEGRFADPSTLGAAREGPRPCLEGSG